MNAEVSGKPLLVVVWRVCETCSLQCQFCGYSGELLRSRTSIDPQQVITFGRVLRDVQRQSNRSILVSWLGGEPLAWKDLPSLSRVYCREYGLRLGVTTNGIPLTSPQVRRYLVANFEQITISIDGLAVIHDTVRGQTGLFEQLRTYVSLLQAEDTCGRLLVRVNTVLMRDNVDTFDEFCGEMANWGIHELTFNQLGGNERPEFFAAHRLLPEHVDRFAASLPHLRRQMSQRGMSIRGSERYLDRIVATTVGRRIGIDDCQPASEFLFIDAQGCISPCSFSSSTYGIPITEICTANQFAKLQDHFREMRKQTHLAACDDCHATHVFDKFNGSTIQEKAAQQVAT